MSEKEPRIIPKLRCPYCQEYVSRIIDSRPSSHDSVIRIRRCITCGHQFSTEERLTEQQIPTSRDT